MAQPPKQIPPNDIFSAIRQHIFPPKFLAIQYNRTDGIHTHTATAGGSDSVSVFIVVTLVVNNVVSLSGAPENCVSYMLNLRS